MFVPLQLYQGLVATPYWDFVTLLSALSEHDLFFVVVRWGFGSKAISVDLLSRLSSADFLLGSRLTRRLYHAVRQVNGANRF